MTQGIRCPLARTPTSRRTSICDTSSIGREEGVAPGEEAAGRHRIWFIRLQVAPSNAVELLR